MAPPPRQPAQCTQFSAAPAGRASSLLSSDDAVPFRPSTCSYFVRRMTEPEDDGQEVGGSRCM